MESVVTWEQVESFSEQRELTQSTLSVWWDHTIPVRYKGVCTDDIINCIHISIIIYSLFTGTVFL